MHSATKRLYNDACLPPLHELVTLDVRELIGYPCFENLSEERRVQHATQNFNQVVIRDSFELYHPLILYT